MTTFVSYYRVSTAKQGASGLGLEAQQTAVREHLRRVEGRELASFTEIESGKRNDRPKLEAAMLRCRQTGATLLVAKLDRLSRDAAFLLQLRNSTTKFVCADMPEANELTIGLLAIVAEHERKMISKRTKDALQAARARGVKLGNPNLRLGTPARAANASRAARAGYEARAEDLRPAVEAAGTRDPKVLCQHFQLLGIPSPRGAGQWDVRAAKRLLKHLTAKIS